MSNTLPYAVFGATGRTGAAAADALLRAGLPVRVVLRDPARGGAWAARGAEIVQADLTDADALTRVLTGVRGAYVVSPQQYGRADLFELADRIAQTVARAAVAARVPKLVALSSVGADLASGSGWIRMNRMLEQRLSDSGIAATFLRAAYFMENWTPMIGQAVATGGLPSFLSPAGRRIAMVAAADVGRAGAEFLVQEWTGARAITVSGPQPYAPKDVLAALAAELGKPLRLDTLAQDGWAGAMAGAGFSPEALEGFIEMTRGLNSGHIGMDTDPEAEHWAGSIPLARAVGGMARAVRGAFP